MAKSVFSNEYQVFLKLLRAARLKAGLTQEDLAPRLGMTQSAISKCERGERRLDVVELRQWCDALGTRLDRFVRELDAALGGRGLR